MENISEQKQNEKLEEFSGFNKKLSDCVLYLGWRLEVLTYLRTWGDKANKEQIDKTAITHGHFFIITEPSIYNHIIVTFDNILDSKSHGILKYLEKTHQELKYLVPNEIERESFGKEVIGHKELIKNHSAINHLRDRRDRRVAHFDKEYFFPKRKSR